MNEIIHEVIQYLKDSGMGGMIGFIVFMAVMTLGWKLLEKINAL
jgi:hypothetical protein